MIVMQVLIRNPVCENFLMRTDSPLQLRVCKAAPKKGRSKKEVKDIEHSRLWSLMSSNSSFKPRGETASVNTQFKLCHSM